MLDWREANLVRKPPVFTFLHRWVKVLAILVGFAGSVVSLMAVVGMYNQMLVARLAAAVLLALAVPAIVTWSIVPRRDPLIAIGIPSETYALMLLAFAVLFIVVAHRYSAPLLIREGDRQAREGEPEVARAVWFLAGVQPPPPPPPESTR
jgi:hypothetical protein